MGNKVTQSLLLAGASVDVIIYPDTVRSSIEPSSGRPLREGEATGNHSSCGSYLFLEFFSKRLHLREKNHI